MCIFCQRRSLVSASAASVCVAETVHVWRPIRPRDLAGQGPAAWIAKEGIVTLGVVYPIRKNGNGRHMGEKLP